MYSFAYLLSVLSDGDVLMPTNLPDAKRTYVHTSPHGSFIIIFQTRVGFNKERDVTGTQFPYLSQRLKSLPFSHVSPEISPESSSATVWSKQSLALKIKFYLLPLFYNHY